MGCRLSTGMGSRPGPRLWMDCMGICPVRSETLQRLCTEPSSWASMQCECLSGTLLCLRHVFCCFPEELGQQNLCRLCILRFSCVRGLCDWCMQVQRPESSAQELVICLPHQHICRSKGADAITPSNKIALPRPNVTQQTVASRFLSRALMLISAETPHQGHCIL